MIVKLLVSFSALLICAQAQQVSSLSPFSGTTNIAFSGSRPAPLGVTVLDDKGAPLAGVPVVWSVQRGGASFEGEASQVTTVSNSQGRATASPNFRVPAQGLSSEIVEIEASSGSARGMTFRILSLGAAPVVSVRKPDPLVMDMFRGEVWSQSYQVSFAFADGPESGKGIPGISMRMTSVEPVRSPNGGFVPETQTSVPFRVPFGTCIAPSNQQGIVSCDIGAAQSQGTVRLYGIAGENLVLPPLTLNVSSDTPPKLEIVEGNNQIGRPRDQLPIPLRVRAVDSSGLPMPGLLVGWFSVSGSAFAAEVFTRTDEAGYTSAQVTLGDRAGAIRFRATTERGAFAEFQLAASSGKIGGLEIVQGNGQAGLPGQPFPLPLVVRAYDFNRVGAPGIPVSFNAPNGILSSNTVTTDQDGFARVTATAPDRGSVVITASAEAFSVLFIVGAADIPFTVTKVENAASGDEGLTPCGIARLTGKGIAPGVEGTLTAPTPRVNLGPVQSISIARLPAPILAVRNAEGVESIDLQVPCEVPIGQITASMVIGTFASTAASGFTAMVKASQPGIFEITEGGSKYVRAIHADGSAVTPANPATRGETIRIHATGLGRPASSEDLELPLATDLIAGIDDAGVPVLRAVYSQTTLLYLVDVEIPQRIPADALTTPLVLAIRPQPEADPVYSNTVRVPIR